MPKRRARIARRGERACCRYVIVEQRGRAGCPGRQRVLYRQGQATSVSTSRPLVVLYNPVAGFHTIPLALIALGSALKHDGVDVRVIDGRVERDPQAAVIAATRDAAWLGVTALTGAPLRDALSVTRAVSAAHPALPIIWGGWHPSLFPVETLREAGVKATVQGQGERPLLEIVRRLAAGEPAFAEAT